MNRSSTLAAILLLAVSCSKAMAIDISWFEQRTAGSAEGEVRIAGLQAGELDVRTPGHDLEVGIMRYGDRAVVTLSRRNPLPMPQAGPEILTVTARQGNAQDSAGFRIVRAAPEAVPEAALSVTGTESRIPAEDAPAEANIEREDAAPLAPDRMEEVSPAPRPPDDTCPVLTVKPGSLRNNVSRLISECGAGLGEWVTYGGHIGMYTDWVVHDPEVLAENNMRGLEGLLEQLERHYSLKGVRHPRLPHTIDVYKIEEGKE